jgi:hypothetical protein
MNPDLFSYYLIDTSKLRELGYQDLETLIARFPYCQNLHFLIAKKAHVEHHPDFERWLHKAATYSTDRSYLYQLLHEVSFSKDFVENEEKFDLDTLPITKEEVVVVEEQVEVENLEAILLPIETMPSAVPSVAEKNNFVASPIDHSNVGDDDDEPLMTLSDLLAEATSTDEQIEEIKEEETTVVLPQNEEEMLELKEKTRITTAKAIAPLPKSSFNSWKKKATSKTKEKMGISIVSDEAIEEYNKKIEEKIIENQEKKKKTKKALNLDGYIDKSLEQNEDLATETLAGILALQGRKSEAIAMFDKLKLQIPEKSAFFAAEIEKLKIK